jgi:hypothetical protein
MQSGEDKAWEELASMDASVVARNAAVSFDEDRSCYAVRSLAHTFFVCPEEKAIRAETPDGAATQKRFAYFLNLSLLCYLVRAKDMGLTGRHLKPEQLRGGQQFFQGTHVLPLPGLAGKYGASREGLDAFLERARELGGNPLGFGDASVELFPLPRIPVTLILWLGDDEFPARADLLFDSSSEHHIPLDIIWSAAMLTVLAML